MTRRKLRSAYARTHMWSMPIASSCIMIQPDDESVVPCRDEGCEDIDNKATHLQSQSNTLLVLDKRLPTATVPLINATYNCMYALVESQSKTNWRPRRLLSADLGNSPNAYRHWLRYWKRHSEYQRHPLLSAPFPCTTPVPVNPAPATPVAVLHPTPSTNPVPLTTIPFGALLIV